jgi:hypothetical protein
MEVTMSARPKDALPKIIGAPTLPISELHEEGKWSSAVACARRPLLQ